MTRYIVEIIYFNGNIGPFTDTYTISASSATEAENKVLELFEDRSRVLSCCVVGVE